MPDPFAAYAVKDDPFSAYVATPATQEQISSPAAWSEKLGLNQSAAPEGMFKAGLRGAASGAVDLAQGITSGAAKTVYGASDLGNFMRGKLGMQQYPTEGALRTSLTTAPDSFSGNVGRGLETAAEMAVPIGGAAKAIPSTARAGKAFESVMSVAKDVPVNLGPAGDVALRIQQLADRGASMPQVVRKFLQRATNPAMGDMPFSEARDFASNISRLSADETSRLTPVMKRELGNLRQAFNQSIGQAAETVGKGSEYAGAMSEYAKAQQIRSALSDMMQGVKSKAGWIGAGAAGGLLYDKAKHLVAGE